MFRRLISILVVTGFLFTGMQALAMNKSDLVNPTQTTTLTGTIVKLNAALGNVVIKDQSGKLWELAVPSQSGIDLSPYKVGDGVTATGKILTTTPTRNKLGIRMLKKGG